ncbi:MAG: lipopolysaccharide biosynthesis protein [Candidatus Promineifilaceae bacterium]
MKALASSLKSGRLLSPTVTATAMLFAIDMVTNLTDYAFHIYLGWSLSPADFAIVQTLNAVLLIVVTAFAVLQPVVARFTAMFNARREAVYAKGQPPQTPARLAAWVEIMRRQVSRHPVDPRSRAVFLRYMRQGLLLGLLLFAAAWLLRTYLAAWLNVPVAALSAASFLLLLVLLRPVAFGMLQGQQQFTAFGLSRTAYAVGRLLLAVIFISLLGGAAVAGVAAMPLGALLSLAVALAFLGRDVWLPTRSGEAGTVDEALIREGWRLSLAALFAYAAFMSLQNLDLIWANRYFAPPAAGAYATAVVFRRILVVLPGAILVILYPRIVTQVTRHRSPDRLLLKAAAVIIGVTGCLTVIYFLFGPWLVNLLFGKQYAAAAPLLGWMGLAMIAYAVASIWLNLYLATRPWPFVAMLTAVTGVQILMLSRFHETLQQLVTVFLITGWTVAVAGLILYVAWMRPELRRGKQAYANERATQALSAGFDEAGE